MTPMLHQRIKKDRPKAVYALVEHRGVYTHTKCMPLHTANGEQAVKGYISRLNLSKSEKTALLRYSGYGA